MHRENKLGVIDTGEVTGAGGLHLFGLGGKRERVDEVVGDESMPLEGNHEAEVAALALAESVVTIQNKANATHGVAVVATGVVEVVVVLPLAAAACSPDEFDDGVVKVDGEVDGRRGLDGEREALDGVHELLEAGGGEAVTLGTVEVDIEALEVHVDVRILDSGAAVAIEDARGVGVFLGEGAELDALAQRSKLDDDLDSVELQGDEGEGISGVVGEPEGKGDIEDTGALGVGHELGDGKALADHFEQALAGLAGQLFPHEEVVVVHGVDDLATNDDGHALGNVLANGVHPMAVRKFEAGAEFRVGGRGQGIVNATGDGAALCDFDAVATRVTGVDAGEVLATDLAGIITSGDSGKGDLEVGEVEQVSGSIETYLDFGAEAGTDDVLENGLEDEVGVFGVAKAPKSDCRILGQKLVHGTKTNQLG